MKKTLIITTLLAVLMCGCERPPVKLEKKSADEIVKSITYARDEKTGICYAVLGQLDKNFSTSYSIAEVSCNKAFQDPNDPICGDPVEFKKHFPANAAPATNANTHKH